MQTEALVGNQGGGRSMHEDNFPRLFKNNIFPDIP